MHPSDTEVCFRSHMGIWAMHPLKLQDMLSAIKAGLWPTLSYEEMQAQAAIRKDSGRLYAHTEDGVALVRISGHMSKGPSKFGGTSSVLTRRALRDASRDDKVSRALLVIDSPGGQVDGVQELSQEVKDLNASGFPVDAYIEDLGASAAYWAASYARNITANATGFIGSIGAFAVLEDVSGMAEREGVKVHVVSTGPHKGLGAPGTPITEELLSDAQKQVDQIGKFFFSAVEGGRRISGDALNRVTTGQTWIAAEAKKMGLIDGIQTFEQALELAASKRVLRLGSQRKAMADLRGRLEARKA